MPSCTQCKRNIAAGAEAQKMIIEYQQPDGTTKVFGYGMPDGTLAAATGKILRAYHHKHYHAMRKRDQRLASRDEERAKAALEQTTAARDADPDYRPTDERDWRPQTVADI